MISGIRIPLALFALSLLGGGVVATHASAQEYEGAHPVVRKGTPFPLPALHLGQPIPQRLDGQAEEVGATTPQSLETAAASSRLRIAKWSSLFASIGTAGYGFHMNDEANRAFDDLEERCLAANLTCRARQDDGSFQDPLLERDYQRVLSIDRRARVALVAGQVGLAAAVVLFILDLGGSGPDIIPFDPPRLRFEADGGVGWEGRVKVRGR